MANYCGLIFFKRFNCSKGSNRNSVEIPFVFLHCIACEILKYENMEINNESTRTMNIKAYKITSKQGNEKFE